MKIERIYPDAVEFASLLDQHGLLDDSMRSDPQRLVGAAMTSEIYMLRAGRRDFGVAWLGNIVPGHTCDLHIVTNRQHRFYMRPKSISPRYDAPAVSVGKRRFLSELFDRAFVHYGVRRLTGWIPSNRRAAQRLARCMGFKHEGRLRDAAQTKGRVQDVDIFGLTKETWHGLYGTCSSVHTRCP